MTATHMQTPVGPMRIREGVRKQLAKLADEELTDRAFGSRFIDPEAFAEMCHRGLTKEEDV